MTDIESKHKLKVTDHDLALFAPSGKLGSKPAGQKAAEIGWNFENSPFTGHNESNLV